MSRALAVNIGKMQTQGRCVFTGVAGTDGAHFFPAAENPIDSRPAMVEQGEEGLPQ